MLGGTVDIIQSCFEGGSSDYVVFIDASSTYTTSQNYITSYSSQKCPESSPDGRLFMEDAGSGCFIGGNICAGTCSVLADQSECRAEEMPSPTTEPVPTLQPTTAAPAVAPPNSIPTTAAPAPGMIIPPSMPTAVVTTLSPTISETVSPTKPFKSVKQPTTTQPPAQNIPVAMMQKPSEQGGKGVVGDVECEEDYYSSKHGYHHHPHPHHKGKGGSKCSKGSKSTKSKKSLPSKKGKGKGKGRNYFKHHNKYGMGKGSTGHRQVYWDPAGKGFFVSTGGRTFTSSPDTELEDGNEQKAGGNQRFLRVYPQGEIVEEFYNEDGEVEAEASMYDIIR